MFQSSIFSIVIFQVKIINCTLNEFYKMEYTQSVNVEDLMEKFFCEAKCENRKDFYIEFNLI